jgi:CBS-domain-containing membrane protein
MMHFPIREIMTREVVTVPATMPIQEVAALLRERRITGVPVVDDRGRVLGVVSEVDLLSRRGATAGDIMSREVISVTEETDVDEVARLFVDWRIRRVPVLADGRLVGIVGRADLLRPSALGHVRGTLDVVQESSLTRGPLDVVQAASEDSFPASDPPSYTQPTGDEPHEQR